VLPLLDSISGAATDQAAGLRRLFGARAARVVAFVSGREACGRTTLLVRTARALAESGQGVVIIDENSGADNAHSALGLKVRDDLLDLVHGGRPIERLLQPAARRLNVMSAARFAAEVHRVEKSAAERLDAALGRLQEGNSFILIDCAARNGQHHSPLALAAPHVAVVVAAQSTAITRAYTLIKHLAHERGCDGFHVAITRARTEQEASAIFHNMRHTAGGHLDVRLDYLGSARVPKAEHLAAALQSGLSPTPEGVDCFGFLPFSQAAVTAAAAPKRLAAVS
jgi:flagellar biosynthesis protein FlhG